MTYHLFADVLLYFIYYDVQCWFTTKYYVCLPFMLHVLIKLVGFLVAFISYSQRKPWKENKLSYCSLIRLYFVSSYSSISSNWNSSMRRQSLYKTIFAYSAIIDWAKGFCGKVKPKIPYCPIRPKQIRIRCTRLRITSEIRHAAVR